MDTTPGPWFCDTDMPYRDDTHIKSRATGEIVASHIPIKDAKLVAAAPDLLAALEAIVQQSFGLDFEVMENAREAIIKAKGHQ